MPGIRLGTPLACIDGWTSSSFLRGPAHKAMRSSPIVLACERPPWMVLVVIRKEPRSGISHFRLRFINDEEQLRAVGKLGPRDDLPFSTLARTVRMMCKVPSAAIVDDDKSAWPGCFGFRERYGCLSCPGSELNQRHADFQTRVRCAQSRVFVRFLPERAGAVGPGWGNTDRDPTRTPTRRRTDTTGGKMAHGCTSRRCIPRPSSRPYHVEQAILIRRSAR